MKKKIDIALIVLLVTAYAVVLAVNFAPIYGLYIFAAAILWVELQKIYGISPTHNADKAVLQMKGVAQLPLGVHVSDAV